jgi:hypothetical protein
VTDEAIFSVNMLHIKEKRSQEDGDILRVTAPSVNVAEIQNQYSTGEKNNTPGTFETVQFVRPQARNSSSWPLVPLLTHAKPCQQMPGVTLCTSGQCLASQNAFLSFCTGCTWRWVDVCAVERYGYHNHLFTVSC